MSYTPVLDEDQLDISTEIDLFIRHVDSIGSVLPGMVMAVQGVSRCAFPPGCSCLQLSEPLLGGEATQDHVAPAAVIDPQVGREQLIASR